MTMTNTPEFTTDLETLYSGWTIAQLQAAEADYNQRCEDHRKEGNDKEALRWAFKATVMALALDARA